MKQDKYIVKIPVSEGSTEYKETKFKSQQEVCEFLDIKVNTLYAFMSGRLQMVHHDKQKLKGIVIEKINLGTARVKKTEEEKQKELEEYKKGLLEKIETNI